MKKILFLSAALFLSSMLFSQSEERKVYVLIAAADIQEGVQIKKENLKRAEKLYSEVEPDSFIYNTDADLSKVSGFTARVKIPKGAQIKKSAISTQAENKVTFASKIPVQWRAYVYEVDRATYNITSADDSADLLVSFPFSGNMVSSTILQRIKIVNKKAEEGRYYLVLAVDPRDAQYLFLMQNSDEVSLKLILRPADETSTSKPGFIIKEEDLNE